MTKKVIIFGMGKILNKWINTININQVIAFTDNDTIKYDTVFGDRPCIAPKDIKKYDYDFIVIFTTNFARQIYKQLTDVIKVESEKIISWQYFIYMNSDNKSIFDLTSLRTVLEVIKKMQIDNILDVYAAFEKMYIFTKDFFKKIDIGGIKFDAYCGEKEKIMPIYHNIYDTIYNSMDFVNEKRYDALMLIDLFLDYTVEECEAFIERTYEVSEYVILTIPYPYPVNFTKWSTFNFKRYGNVRKISVAMYQVIIIEKIKRTRNKDLHIYIASHKAFLPPKDISYIPIQAGANGELGFLRDDKGNNISYLNPLINECTVLFWIWKHDKAKYVGLNHYRRYLLKNSIWYDIKNIVDYNFVERIMMEYDIILANQFYTYPYTVSEHIRESLDAEVYEGGISIVKELIKTKSPGYLMAFEKVFTGFSFYPCNIFISKREIIDNYCKWLFDIIIEAAERIDVSLYDSYSKRIIGFIAERLLTVWLLKNKYKIKELPLLITE